MNDYYGRTKKCLKKYSLSNNDTFGWAPKFYDKLLDIEWNG